VIRDQFKEGSDFVKIYETGHDSIHDGVFSTPYQYTQECLFPVMRPSGISAYYLCLADRR
jgi:hypothetical protein